ncbi:MAG: 3-oxoacyl-[acyl-carrier-protein] synthase [Gaiellales bacterium]|jgi:3-oxoacyl-[acyl-carrier-protein] synthase II|nr:3-oxoacyl-[acyl-carrier-protein] synthase [Gaiellales bacterium]MDX6593402.1 3-oxoacyl-[acyl-carrier-protein] synthase [Gaiellales bacterium]
MSEQNGRRRVVITGIGAVTPCGPTAEETWKNVREGRSGVSTVEGYDGNIRIAGQITDFDAEQYMERRAVRRTDRFAHFAVAAATQAVADAGIDISADADRIGCSMGTGIGGLKTQEVAHAKLFSEGPDRLNPFWVTALIPNMGAAEISMRLGTRGPLTTECTACAASAMSLGNATMYIRSGMADAMLAGGVEAPIVPLGLGGFGTMRALSRRNDDPQAASRPFDGGRDGFILAEGGAVLVLEELERARARGAKIYAEVAGYGMSSDAHHVTEPDPVGANPSRAMRNAMKDAGVTPDEIGYVNAHGTSTPAGDAAETRALKLALGEERAYQVPVSSTKSETGHLLGAAGALETIITVLAMRDSYLPPTINQTDPDPDCDLDYIPNVGREAEVDVALTNSFGFGGHNAVLVLRRWDDQ